MKSFSGIILVLFLISGCGWVSSLNPFPSEKEKKAAGVEQAGVNPYLWQASLNKVKFMPLATSDSKAGIIVTDWASMDNVSNENFKITIHVMSKELRADALDVKVFKRVWFKERWESLDVDPRVAGELERAIIMEARNLFRLDNE